MKLKEICLFYISFISYCLTIKLTNKEMATLNSKLSTFNKYRIKSKLVSYILR